MPEMPRERRMKTLATLIEAHKQLTHDLHYNYLSLTRKSTRRYMKLKRSLERRIFATKIQVLCGMTWYEDGRATIHFAIPSTPCPNVLPILYRRPSEPT